MANRSSAQVNTGSEHFMHLVCFDTGDPSGFSRPLKVRQVLDSAIPSNRTLQVQLGRLQEAEYDLIYRWDLLLTEEKSLLNLKEEAVSYPYNYELPEGVLSAGTVPIAVGAVAARRCEAMVSLVLDGIYILADRICKASAKFNVESSGRVWPGFDSTNQKIILATLNDQFGKAHPNESTLFRIARSTRGARTHESHYMVWLEGNDRESLTPTYGNELPWANPRPEVRFTSKELRFWVEATMKFLEWWSVETSNQLSRLVPRT